MHRRKTRYAVTAMGIAACLLALCGPAVRASSPPRDTGDGTTYAPLMDLLRATRSARAARSLDLDSLITGHAEPDSGSPLLPVYRFLLAEAHLLRGEEDTAYRYYADLAGPALSSPGGDVFGTTLATFFLLRLAQSTTAGTQAEAARAADLVRLAVDLLIDKRSLRSFELPVLGGLPRLGEIVLKETALLGWSVEDRKAAGALFKKYLEVASTADLGPEEPEITDYLVSSGMGSMGEFALARGKRLLELRRYDDARRFLSEARASDIPEVRARGGYYLARTRSTQGAPRGEVIDLLTSAIRNTRSPLLMQQILFYRAEVMNRSGAGRDTARALADLNRIVEDFPLGRFADDALYEIAKHYQAEGEVDEALEWLARLRNHPGPNNWMGSAHFRAALIHYGRHGPGDTDEAIGLLGNLIDMGPGGDLSQAARFWLGRMAAEAGDTRSARGHFEHLIEVCPYDYYAIRARMHLNLGTTAAGRVRIDPRTAADLAAGPGGGQPEYNPTANSPCADLMPEAVGSRLYEEVLSAMERLSGAYPGKHPSEFTPEELDSAGAYAAAAVLLFLRHNAVEAAARCPDRRQKISIAASAGAAGDWPLAMLLIFGLDRSVETQSVLQNSRGYLAAAYPPVYRGLIAKAAAANGVPPELLYGVIRRESLFHPPALSNRGALGLFQFIPSTFETLDKRWNLLGGSGTSSMQEFLNDPRLAIDLGGRWFAEELLQRHDGNILLAVMEHNAGYPAVRRWMESWKNAGRSGDIEYMIESAEFTETRIFARAVLADMAIADATGLFSENRGTPSAE